MTAKPKSYVLALVAFLLVIGSMPATGWVDEDDDDKKKNNNEGPAEHQQEQEK